MAYKNLPIHARLAAAKRAIRGALDNPDVLALLSARSFDKKAVEAGLRLYERAYELGRHMNVERSAHRKATNEVNALRKKLQGEYAEDLAVARVELKADAGARTLLGLEGVRERSFSAWMAQARRFYDGLEDSKPVKIHLEKVGLNKAVLEARSAALEALESARVEQDRRRGEAQELTRQRREAMAELDAWMSRFIPLAHVALKDRPQWMEKLGIMARS